MLYHGKKFDSELAIGHYISTQMMATLRYQKDTFQELLDDWNRLSWETRMEISMVNAKNPSMQPTMEM